MPDLWTILLPRSPDQWWMLAVCAMVNMACGLIGCYLVLRRMSLMGDAISHAVLPGLVLAFIFTGSLSIGPMFAGAFAIGLLTTFLTQALHRHGGVPADAGMGVVFTSLFALGVVLLKRYTGGGVDLDVDCVLQGQLALMPANQVEIAGRLIPRAALSISPVLLLNSLFILLFWKELKLSSFDPALATTMGFRAGLLHYLLMAMVAVTTVASFEAVGSILVIAMLIVPGATAHLWTDRLARMVFLSALIGFLSAYLGVVATLLLNDAGYNAEPAGMVAVTGGAIFFLSVLFAPRYGVLSTILRNWQTATRIVGEDLLAMLYRLEELGVRRPLGAGESAHAVGGGLAPRLALLVLARRREIHFDGGLRLTELGRQHAMRLVRSHRLWEAFLVEHLGLPLDHVHAPAERMEHYIGDDLREQIAGELTTGPLDPHGREIPR